MKTLAEALQLVALEGADPDHALEVLARLHPDATHEERLATILHDLVEDTHVTLEALEGWDWPAETIEIVKILSRNLHPEGTTYRDYIWEVKQHVSARLVKLADLTHNFQRSEEGDPRKRKYADAIQDLTGNGNPMKPRSRRRFRHNHISGRV